MKFGNIYINIQNMHKNIIYYILFFFVTKKNSRTYILHQYNLNYLKVASSIKPGVIDEYQDLQYWNKDQGASAIVRNESFDLISVCLSEYICIYIHLVACAYGQLYLVQSRHGKNITVSKNYICISVFYLDEGIVLNRKPRMLHASTL